MIKIGIRDMGISGYKRLFYNIAENTLMKSFLLKLFGIPVILFLILLLPSPFDFGLFWMAVIVGITSFLTDSPKEKKDNLEEINRNNKIIAQNKADMKGGATPGSLFYAQSVAAESDLSLKKIKTKYED